MPRVIYGDTGYVGSRHNMTASDHNSTNYLTRYQLQDLISDSKPKTRYSNTRSQTHSHRHRETDTDTQRVHTIYPMGVEPMDVVYGVWECMECDECDHYEM